MSAEALSKLSLVDTMVTTRAGAARARTAPAQTPQHASTPSPSHSPTSTAASSPTPSLIESAQGLTYNLSPFDDDVRRRAKRGLMDDNDIEMKYCKTSPTDPSEYLFYVDDDITVAIGGERSKPKCSCGLNEGGKACKHIFWMLDHLATGAPGDIKSQTLQLARDGSSLQNIPPAKMIGEMGMENVARGLAWPLQDGLPEEENDVVDEIAEILSVFEPSDALPAEFKKPESPTLSERAYKYHEFKEIITQHALRNPGLFIRLQSVITLSFRGHVFFEKISGRVARAFKALENYIANGPTNAPFEAHDVVSCASKLKALVQSIADYYDQHDEDEPDTKNVANRAAGALISILDGVANRNFDAYANITWGAIPPADYRDANLFTHLICKPDVGGKLFVLDVLQSLPQDDVLRGHGEDIHNLGDKLAKPFVPAEYLNTFRSISQGNRKRAASEVGGGSAKRPTMES
ncbi:hypothetical protein BS50DRAFT_640119 [Corynespora cassiicola Philippines]|uniref:SWIM-type domain-containing protein n=1 Tax=Corynespora cassiicola Philippines TaxID=1448308 RepID=A0A2T2N4I6_CORCC|nr:hypothetical protein BS50DRAFT_640119 [Corynespora cassiicola Philippines]